MAGPSRIEWTEATWNPTTGCDRTSPGCDNCYALTMARRLKAMGNPKYQRDGDPSTSGPGFGVTVHPDVVNRPLHWPTPHRVFVNSMSDLFHKDVPTPWLADIFAVMAAARWHTFQVLTKRHARMRSVLNDPAFADAVWERASTKGMRPGWAWPLPNVWLGVSAETQQWADIRVPALLDTPAAVRFVSAEPLLGPITLHPYWTYGEPVWGSAQIEPTGVVTRPLELAPRVDWLIVGGESGPGARPMHPGWARTLRDQCEDAGVAYFHKQHGAWVAVTDVPRDRDVWVHADGSPATEWCRDDGHFRDGTGPYVGGQDYSWVLMRRVGKKTAGRVLDGRTWDEFPAVAR